MGGIFALAVLLAGAWFSAVASDDFVFVKAGYSGKEDGSYSKPFNKIQEAIDEARDQDKDVFIRKGKYKENIEIWEDVEVHGSGMDKVEIIAEDDDEPVVTMNDDTYLKEVTVKEGEYGILVEDDAKVQIRKVRVFDNEKDGIKAEKGETSNEYLVEIYECLIGYNEWNGIYMEERKSSIKDNEIFENEKDGVELEDDSEAILENNRIKDNDGVGLRLTIDESEIYLKDNTFRDNDKSGLEIRAEGEEGIVKVYDESKFYKNDKYGIVRLQEAPFTADQWNRSFIVDSDTIFWDNEIAPYSHIIRVD